MAPVVSRRTLLGSGTVLVVGAAVVGTAVATDTLDDALRAVGVEPLPEPDPDDLRLTARALADAIALVELAQASKAPAEVLAALTEQRDSLPRGRPEAPTVGDDLAAACATAADARALDALAATSVDLAQVLASMAAGLDQCATRVRA